MAAAIAGTLVGGCDAASEGASTAAAGRDCEVDADGCTCSTRVVASPALAICSGASLGDGVCCAEPASCSCVQTGCAERDDGSCACGVGQGERACLIAHRTCCHDEGNHTCVCSDGPCRDGQARVLACDVASLSCAFLGLPGLDTPSCSGVDDEAGGSSP